MLSLMFVMNIFLSCKGKITDSCATTEKVYTGTLSEVQSDVFNSFCIGCHGNITSNGGLNLSAGKAYNNLVNIPSTGSTLLRVKPGDTINSYLLRRLNASAGESPMPPSGKLNQSLINLVELWVSKGAQNN